MDVGILGTGEVGRTLGKAFIALGHSVKLGGREASNEKAIAFARENGSSASSGTFADAAAFGELLVLATLGSANEEAVRAAGIDNFVGKVLIDTTNPLDFSKGLPPRLMGGLGDSAGELLQRLLPEAKVVKAFNTVGNAHMFRPDFPGGPPDMFICGNDVEAKKEVAVLLDAFGWNVADVGGIQSAHYLEAMCLVWVLYAMQGGGWNHAFKLLQK
jgi:predicted dinucleotide-binding enzyme